MNLYILRHASAGTRRANPAVDVKRPLDKEGKQQCFLVGGFLSALNVQFDRVVSSPLKRALQTASLVGTETGYDGKIEISDALSPEASVGSLLAPGGRMSTRLRKGAIARIDCTRLPGTLHWLVDPRILRGYARATKSSRPKTSRK